MCDINLTTTCEVWLWRTGRGNTFTKRRTHTPERKRWWEQRDLNPPQRISSETAHQMGSLQDCNGSALQLVINFQQTHSSSFPCNWSPRYYQAILYSRVLTLKPQFFACRRARFRRRNFFLRHFQRWLPVFFQAREPRFMVNRPPTCLPYMRASGEPSTLRSPTNRGTTPKRRVAFRRWPAV